jgi:hypothetical protein
LLQGTTRDTQCPIWDYADFISILSYRAVLNKSSGDVYFRADDDGLALPWRGKVFMNPPYGRTLRQWVSKAQAEVTARRAALVVALVPARTETLWWHHHIAGAADAFMLRGRLSFGNDTPAPFPSALILWGASSAQLDTMRREFPTAWHAPSSR